LWKGVDVRVIDGIVNGSAKLVAIASQWFRKVQTGVAQMYAIVFIGGIFLILTWLLFQ